MNGLPYYKRYARDFIEGTQGMPYELKAAYSLVLDLIYIQSGYLPDDARYIAGVLGVSVRKWTALRAGLIDSGKLAVTGGHLTNYRAIKEVESLGKFQDKQRENRSRPNKNNRLQKPRSHHTDPESYTPQTPRAGGPDNLEFFEGKDPVRLAQAAAIRNCVEWQTRHISQTTAWQLAQDGYITEAECRKAGVL